jgi:hypothetical protein
MRDIPGAQLTLYGVHVLLIDRGHDGAHLLLGLKRCLPQQIVDNSKRRRETSFHVVIVLDVASATKCGVGSSCEES